MKESPVSPKAELQHLKMEFLRSIDVHAPPRSRKISHLGSERISTTLAFVEVRPRTATWPTRTARKSRVSTRSSNDKRFLDAHSSWIVWGTSVNIMEAKAKIRCVPPTPPK